MLLIICNPVAGARSAPQFIDAHVVPLLKENKIEFDLCSTAGAGDAGKIALRFVQGLKKGAGDTNTATVVVGGGDGTLHEVVNSLFLPEAACVGLRLQFVILPLGTANALYSSLFPHSPTDGDIESVEYKLHSLRSFLTSGHPGSLKPLVIQSTSIYDKSQLEHERILSVVVTSTALHASILQTAEELRTREDLKGVERFRVAAERNLQEWYSGRLSLTVPVEVYRPESKALEAVETTVLDGPFTYVLSTVNVDRLEPHFMITRLHAKIPVSYPHMDLVIMRPLRHPTLSSLGDTPAAREKYAQLSIAALQNAYKDGAHVDMRYGSDGVSFEGAGEGEPVVEYHRCQGWEWTPMGDEPKSRLICADGSILSVPEGGRAVCRLLSEDEMRCDIGVWS